MHLRSARTASPLRATPSVIATTGFELLPGRDHHTGPWGRETRRARRGLRLWCVHCPLPTAHKSKKTRSPPNDPPPPSPHPRPLPESSSRNMRKYACTGEGYELHARERACALWRHGGVHTADMSAEEAFTKNGHPSTNPPLPQPCLPGHQSPAPAPTPPRCGPPAPQASPGLAPPGAPPADGARRSAPPWPAQ